MLILFPVVTMVGCTDSAAYRGGILDDPIDVVANLRHETVLPNDERAAGLRGEELRIAVDGRIVTIVRRAELCSHEPDILIDASEQELEIRMIVPTGGVPCQNEESHVATLTLKDEFESYKIG